MTREELLAQRAAGSPGGGVGNLDAILTSMGRGPTTGPTEAERAAAMLAQWRAEDPLIARAAMIGGRGPGGNILGTPQIPAGRFSGATNFMDLVRNRSQQLEIESLLRARFGPNVRFSSDLTFMPPGSSSGGNPGNESAVGRGGSSAAGIGSIGANTGGVGMAASDAVTGGFGALGGQAANMGGSISMGGTFGAEQGTSLGGPTSIASSGGAPLGTVSLGSDLAQSRAEGIDSAVATTGVLGGVQSIGTTSTGQNVSVNSSTGVVSVGGSPVGTVGGVGGGGSGGGGGGLGSDSGGVGMDGSSNAGIGGPGGTGAVGSAGDAGQGTGGPGEGDRFGGHFTVGGDPRAGPDSMNVRFKASPGEHVVVVPPGLTAQQILQRPEQQSSWRMTGQPPNPEPRRPTQRDLRSFGARSGGRLGDIEAILAAMRR